MSAYRALARTYRSRHFGELIGQDALVRTLTHAIEKGRIHHAYMFTGIRGTGKTSTARIFAKAINYTGPNGDAGPTTGPTDDCPVCQAIAEDRHPDIIEIDAASNTGVDDVRQIIDNVRYAPVSARYKVFIIDEVHMLSKQAFNALLKTLEEPPPHVVFMLATTEIRKVPVTILSRCQRFDLRRIEVADLTAHYKKIATAEKITIDDEAVHIIARAADGSVRDGLSLFDQAIAQSGGAPITADMLRAMMGRADMGGMSELFGFMMAGDAPAMLKKLEQFHQSGSDPAMILDDIMEFTHFVTRVKIVPSVADQPELPANLRENAKKYAQECALSALARVWQMLLKAVNEVANAPVPQQALDMALIRVAFAAPLPPLEELLKSGPAPQSATHTPPPAGMASPAQSNFTASSTRAVASAAPKMAEPVAHMSSETVAIADFAALVKMAEERDPMLGAELYAQAREVKFTQGRIDIALDTGARQGLVGDLTKKLRDWTGQHWMVVLSKTGGAPTLRERALAGKQAAIDAAYGDSAIKAFITGMPGAKIINFKTE